MDRFTKEAAAYEAFVKLIADGKTCRTLFEVAGMDLPPPLLRFLGEDSRAAQDDDQLRVSIPAPQPPARPAEWQSGWIWVPVGEATDATLVRGILRAADHPLTAKQIVAKYEELSLVAIPGTIANIGTRLATSKPPEIEREGGSWGLLSATKCPILHERYLWGPIEVFEKYDTAAHRRLLIIHVLNAHSDGLQIIQLTRALEGCAWFDKRIPMTKDLIKDDLHVLQESNKVRRLAGYSGKWMAVDSAQTNQTQQPTTRRP